MLSAHNLVIVHTDTLRADRLPMYGGPHDTLPRIGSRPWQVVDGVYAASSWTAPSSASLFTGLDLQDHGVRYYVPTSSGDGTANRVLTAPTFVEHLHGLGYATGLFAGNDFVSTASGFARGADIMYNHGKDRDVSNLSQLISAATAWIDGLPHGQPFMMLFQPMDVHDAYWPRDEDLGTWCDPATLPLDLEDDALTQETELYANWQSADEAGRDSITRQMHDLYDEQILSLDRSVDALLTALEARGLLDDTLVVLTSDHGEKLNEEGDGQFNHGRTIREEETRIPLLLPNPGLPGGTQRCQSRNLDVFPTPLGAMGLPAMSDVEGVNLEAGCRALSLSSNYWLDGSLYFVSAENETQRLVWDCATSTEQTYDLEADPRAVADLGEGGLYGADTVIRAALTAFVLDILASVPGTSCPIAVKNGTLPKAAWLEVLEDLPPPDGEPQRLPKVRLLSR
jgi:arylsulfatase